MLEKPIKQAELKVVHQEILEKDRLSWAEPLTCLYSNIIQQTLMTLAYVVWRSGERSERHSVLPSKHCVHSRGAPAEQSQLIDGHDPAQGDVQVVEGRLHVTLICQLRIFPKGLYPSPSHLSWLLCGMWKEPPRACSGEEELDSLPCVAGLQTDKVCNGHRQGPDQCSGTDVSWMWQRRWQSGKSTCVLVHGSSS